MDESYNNSSLKHSPEFGKLAEALCKAQDEFGPVKKDSENPYYHSSYADLATLIAATKPALSKNGLIILQSPGRVKNGSAAVTTMLLHTSQQWFRDELEMPITKQDAQGVGSAITYARRYAYQAMLNIAAEDDDANAATGKPKNSRASETEDEYDQRTEDQRNILQHQILGFIEACKKTHKTEQQVAAYLETLGHKKIEHMSRLQFNEAIKWAWAKPAEDYTQILEANVRQMKAKKANSGKAVVEILDKKASDEMEA